jgi:hypothetical protein
MTRELVIQREQELLPLVYSGGSRKAFRKTRLVIRVPRMEEVEARAWESRLESLRQQCGCSTGAVAMCVFVIFYVLYATYNAPAADSNPALGELAVRGGIFFAGLVLSAVGGKTFGLYMGMRRHRRTCLILQQRLRELAACA